MKIALTAVILLVTWVLLMVWFGGDIHQSGRGTGNYEPCQMSGHPLYQDC